MLGIKGVPFLNISHHNCNAVQSSNYCSLESYGAAVVKLICIIRGNKWKSLILPQIQWQRMKWSTRGSVSECSVTLTVFAGHEML